jgi:uncharacterized protein YbjT (DUF2867 family)
MTRSTILVTGAGGKTGQAVVAALARCGMHVRAAFHTAGQETALRRAGAAEFVVADLLDPAQMKAAMQAVQSVYHICPNVHPQEVEIGRIVIDAARAAGVARFVYHSVLRPQIEAMPHHWRKLGVEELLQTSGLNFTILQPAAYMQNLLAGRERIVMQGVHATPYPPEAAISLVDLHDVAAVATRILTETGHDYAVYELCGTLPLSQHAVAATLTTVLGRPVQTQEIPLAAWRASVANVLSEERIDTLARMFAFYAAHGLRGNPQVLGWLLGRPPTALAEFCRREMGGLAGEGADQQ